MWVYKTWSTDSGQVEVSLFGDDPKIREDLSISWNEISDPDFPTQKTYWDNAEYILDIFVPFVKSYINRSITQEQIDEIGIEIYEYMSDDLAAELLEIFNDIVKLNK